MTSARRVMAALVATTLVTSCGGASKQATSAGDTRATRPPSAASGVPADMLWVRGSADCSFPTPGREARQDGVTVTTGDIVCTEHMSDPRVTGTSRIPITISYVDAHDIDKFTFANALLSNDGGRWRGAGYGSEFIGANGQLFTNGFVRYVGEGRYHGLLYYLQFTQAPDLPIASGDSYLYSGWIQRAR